MTIVHMSGGFGNQLFSYAFGYAVAKARGDKLFIDTAIQDQPWFFRNPDILNMNITYDKRLSYHIGRSIFERGIWNKLAFRFAIGLNTRIITEDDLKQVDNPIEYCKSIKGSIYLKGNWGNESWFKPVSEEVKEKFEFKNELSENAKKIADEISSETNPTTMHIRRGDYVKIGIALEKEYFINAMSEIKKKQPDTVFFCFSEDQSWAKDAFKDTDFDIRYPEYESDNKGVEDFRLLQLGKNQILSNSSYSWWAAYLNKNENKIITLPCKEDSIWDKDFLVEGWIPMDFTLCGKKKDKI